MAQGMGYPGEETLLRKYWLETELVDLSRIRKGTSGFKDVGKHLEYIKRQRKDLPKRPAPAQAEQQPQSKNPVSVQGKTPTHPVNQRANTSSPIQGRDRLPVLPTTGRQHRRNPFENLIDGLYGNWRDHWDNTLPER
jgi:hypothetical protein